MAHLIVAAALLRGDRLLLCHRVAGRRYFPDCWDLPGGHVEQDERPEDALVRELKEEIGVDAVVTGQPSLHVEHHPELADGMVLDVWTITSWDGEPVNLANDEHDDLRWVAVEQLQTLDLAHPAYSAFFPALLAPDQPI